MDSNRVNTHMYKKAQDGWSSYVIKNIFARPRPFVINPNVMIFIPEPKGFSFPSGHTVSSFASVAVLFMVNVYAGLFGIILACFISFSRLYLYVHYHSDVIGGVVLGILSCCVSKKAAALIYKRVKRKNIDLRQDL
jgi:undecaprenyl-diphosphatase